MRIWHYTVCRYLPDITKSGKIKLATACLPKGGIPAVWFSTNPVWEETANKGYEDKDGTRHKGTKETTHFQGGGLARIEVLPEAAPYTWEDYRRESKESKRYLDALEKRANPQEWRVSFKPVFKDKWIAVEVWESKTDQWINFMEALRKAKAKAKRRELFSFPALGDCYQNII